MTKKNHSKPSGNEPAEPITAFKVSDGGTLSVADFYEPETRQELYEDLDGWERSPADLAGFVEECQPLAWAVQHIYSDYREELLAQIENNEDQVNPDKKKIAALKKRLASMPDEPEEGTKDWLLKIDKGYFVGVIVKRIREWFSEEWDAQEFDYLPDYYTAQGAALVYFRDLDQASLNLLGVKVVEGEHPVSTYYAAQLRRDVEEANTAAESAGLPVRFVALES